MQVVAPDGAVKHLHSAGGLHGAFHRGQEGRGQARRGGALQIFCTGRIAAFDDADRVLDRQGFNGIDKQPPGDRRRRLRRPVHAQMHIIKQARHAKRLEAFFDLDQAFRQRDADQIITPVAIRLGYAAHGGVRALIERLAQRLLRILIGQGRGHGLVTQDQANETRQSRQYQPPFHTCLRRPV